MSWLRARNRRKSVAPSVAALGAEGAPRSVAPLARSAETSGSPTSADSERGPRSFALRACWGPQPLQCGIWALLDFSQSVVQGCA
eukprot:8082646-Alexandrium_andersonii.AAC.1